MSLFVSNATFYFLISKSIFTFYDISEIFICDIYNLFYVAFYFLLDKTISFFDIHSMSLPQNTVFYVILLCLLVPIGHYFRYLYYKYRIK